MKKYIITALCCLSTFNLSAQSGLKSALIPCKTGAVLAYTDNDQAFTINFITKAIHRNIDKGSYTIEGFELTPFTSDITDAGDNESERRQKQRISRDIKSSMDHIRAELNEPRLAHSPEWITTNGKLYCFWYYKLPGSDKQQLAITTICHDYFFTLSIPLSGTDEFEKAKTLLVGLTDDIKLYDKAMDFKTFYQELNK